MSTHLFFSTETKQLNTSAVGLQSSLAAAASPSSGRLKTALFSKRDTHEGVNTFKMPEVAYTWFDKNHHLRFSILFFALDGVEPEDLKHSVSTNSTMLTINYIVPLEYLSAQDLLGVFVGTVTGKRIYPSGLLRVIAMTEALNQLCAGQPNDGIWRPMFRQIVQLPSICAVNLVGHVGGYGWVQYNRPCLNTQGFKLVTLVYFELIQAKDFKVEKTAEVPMELMAIESILKKSPTMMKAFAKYQRKTDSKKEAKRIKVGTVKAASNNNKDEDKNKQN